jgi:RNA polymerase sigma factor (sigma-70 family)
MSDGEDLAQSICAECAKITDQKWSHVECHRAFIFTRIRWGADKIYQERKGKPLVSVEDMNIPPDRPHRNVLEIALIVNEALDKMPQDVRELVMAADLEGLSTEELAELLHIKSDAVRKRLSRARCQLRDLLAGDAGPPPPG